MKRIRNLAAAFWAEPISPGQGGYGDHAVATMTISVKLKPWVSSLGVNPLLPNCPVGVAPSSMTGLNTVADTSTTIKALLKIGCQLVNPPYAVTTIGSAVINLANGCSQSTGPISGNRTLAASNVGFCDGRPVLFFTQNATATYTATFSTNFTLTSGTGQVIATGAGATDVVELADTGSSRPYPSGENPNYGSGVPSRVTANNGTTDLTL